MFCAHQCSDNWQYIYIYIPPKMSAAEINTFIEEFTFVIQDINCNNINLAGEYNLNLLKMTENAACSNFLT